MRATIAMSKEIGRSIATNKLSELRKLSHDALKKRIGEIECEVVNGADGEYQMETQAFWDGKPSGNIRVMVGIDGPGISSLNFLMEDFIITPDGSFVGEG
jgi:hypothetical protein